MNKIIEKFKKGAVIRMTMDSKKLQTEEPTIPSAADNGIPMHWERVYGLGGK